MQTDKTLTIENARFIVFTLVNNAYEISFSNSPMLRDYPDKTLVHGIKREMSFYLANDTEACWTRPNDQWIREIYPEAFSTLLLLGIPHVPN